MGVSKTQLFTEAQNEVAAVAKVLGHPARVAILQYISRQEGCICNDIVDEIGLAQPTISQHLNEIKKLGLIKGNFEGKTICYCIDTERWQRLQELFKNFFGKINSHCC
ncbi:MAG: ArsR/SmtB family transcription factor [Flavobacteriaceae bacterium]